MKILSQCSNHGTLFRIEDGVCVSGPCLGERLSPITLKIINEQIVLVDESADY